MRQAFDLLVCVGTDAGLIAEAAVASGFAPDNVSRYDDARSASVAIPPALREGDLVLLKGSRSVHLEYVAKALTQRQEAPVRMVAS